MAVYQVTEANWNDAAFWNGVSETGAGQTLEFSDLPDNFSVDVDAALGIVTISDGTSSFTVGEAGVGGTDASFGAGTLLDYFTMLYGGAGEETIDGTASGDVIYAEEGDDTVAGRGGADQIDGGGGADSLSGGGGADTITGGISAQDTELSLDWSAAAADETDISAGFTQDTGGINVSVAYQNDGNATAFTVESSSAQYVGPGEPFSANSAGEIRGGGTAGDTATLSVRFDAVPGSGFQDEVSDVSFRINDIDQSSGSGWDDQITVRAFDADGNPLDVTITYQGVSQTSTAPSVEGTGPQSATDATGSALVEIAGPVAWIEIDYDQLGSSGQVVWISDIHFTAQGVVDGDDTIDGGGGDDYLIGGAGADDIQGGAGADTIHGGDDTSAPVSAPIAITNASFEATSHADGNWSPGIPGWTASGDVGDFDPLASELDAGTIDGENVAYLFSTGDTLSQTLSQTYQDGETYSFDLDLGDATYSGAASYTVNIYAGSTLIGTTSGSTGDTDALSTVTVTSAGYSDPALNGQPITIEIVNTGGGEVLVDAVSGTVTGIAPPTDSDTSGDVIDGGAGADLVFGGGGDDTITVDQGDTVSGGAGDDTFVLADIDTGGTGAIGITGGEDGETGGDTLVLTPDVTLDDITFTNTDDGAGGLSGSFAMDDGTVVTFSEIENIICFTPGARILTQTGERPVETLRVGDMVVTRDSGVQAVRWIGRRTVPGRGRFAPVRIAPAVADGARAELLVSPQHRLLFTGYKAQLLFGQDEVLVAAKYLIDDVAVTRQPIDEITYIHLMFDHHEVIYAEGIATESFHPGDIALSAISEPAREELFAIFPELRAAPRHYGDTARLCLKRHEARLLIEPEDRSLQGVA